jgi:hypothetical protein
MPERRTPQRTPLDRLNHHAHGPRSSSWGDTIADAQVYTAQCGSFQQALANTADKLRAVTAPGQVFSKVRTTLAAVARRNNLRSCDHPSDSGHLCHGAQGIDTLTPLAAAVYAQHPHNLVKPLANIVAERRRSRRW